MPRYSKGTNDHDGDGEKGGSRKAPRYAVTLHGPDGAEVVEVTADSGDEAAAKASKPGHTVRGVVPA